MKVLVACEFSGIVRDAFKKRGHDAWSCDLLPTEREGQHIQGDVLGILNDGWDLMIAHPPCTYLTNAGVRHLHEHVTSKNGVRAKIHGMERQTMMHEAAKFFNALKNSDIKHVCVENPIPHKYAREIIGNYNQIIQPWQFGHRETKATCLWLKNLSPLTHSDSVGPPPKNMAPAEKRSWHRVHFASPGKNRWKERSRTFEGIAKAMSEQWG